MIPMTRDVPTLSGTGQFSRRTACLALFFSAAGLFSSKTNAEENGLDEELNEEIISIPAKIEGRTYKLEATLFRPNKTGKFPLIVINHGTSDNPRANVRRSRFLVAAKVFVARGFAVAAPMRRGYGSSEGYAPHLNTDLTSYGLENAID